MTQPVCRTENMAIQFDEIYVEVNERESRADIVLDSPPLNLITATVAEQLRLAFEEMDDHPAVLVIVLRANGKHFSDGGDSCGVSSHDAKEAMQKHTWAIEAASRCSKPVIAANRGHCFDAGFELSLACDFRISTETTLYALSAQNVGQGVGAGGVERLQQMVGLGRTKDVVMRSRNVPGALAYDWGIATDFVADHELEGFTASLVRELRASPPITQRAAKNVLNSMEMGRP